MPDVMDRDAVPVVGFVVRGRLFAFPVDHVQEIVPAVELTSLPRTPSQVLGITTLRGTVIPMVDLRQLLEIDGSAAAGQEGGRAPGAPAPPDDDSKTVVVRVGERVIGCQVDAVTRVERVAADQLLDVPETIAGTAPSVTGFLDIDGEIWVLLDPEKLLTVDLLTYEAAPL